MEIRRGVLNRVKLSMVCNASATNFRVPPDFPGTFGYANVNLSYQRDNYRQYKRFYRTLESPVFSRVFFISVFFKIVVKVLNFEV